MVNAALEWLHGRKRAILSRRNGVIMWSACPEAEKVRAMLADGPCFAIDAARRLGIPPQTAWGYLARAVKSGLVLRRGYVYRLASV